MECWHCERPSHGICRFCGRAVCREHAQKMPFILSLYRAQEGSMKAVVVGDTLYCGICNPEEEPVPLDGLE